YRASGRESQLEECFCDQIRMGDVCFVRRGQVDPAPILLCTYPCARTLHDWMRRVCTVNICSANAIADFVIELEPGRVTAQRVRRQPPRHPGVFRRAVRQSPDFG